ncbi:RNA polymerase sigma factor [Patescibacteria group bacterium]|nr:RNA polymerase sigma factor [Patescibacteria group bacterium]
MNTSFNVTLVDELAKAAQNGASDAFAQLYDLHIKKIYNFIYYKTLNKTVAEDICSQVFIKAWQKLSQFQGGSFSAWLYTIARNSVSDYYRREHQHLNIDDCWDLSDKEDFLARIDQGLNMEKIQETMKVLKNEEREILMMRFWLDLSFKEIAEQLEKKEGAVKMACGRALKNLQHNMPLVVFMLLPELINICKKMN